MNELAHLSVSEIPTRSINTLLLLLALPLAYVFYSINQALVLISFIKIARVAELEGFFL